MNKLILEVETEYDYTPLAEAVYVKLNQEAKIKAEIIFVSKSEIQQLNKETRNTPSVTDVLSYPTLENIKGEILNNKNYPFDLDEDGNIFIGSIVICSEVAKEQAEEFNHSYERELFYLSTHGLLHLFGYNHIEDNDKNEMREIEEAIMEKISLSRETE
jgi:probable rRNA maturation factor